MPHDLGGGGYRATASGRDAERACEMVMKTLPPVQILSASCVRSVLLPEVLGVFVQD
jgi:hypothetical protein